MNSFLKILRKNLITTALIVIILALSIYSYNITTEKSNYDNYTSEILYNDTLKLASTIAINDYYLNRIVDEGEITQEQIVILQENYQVMHESGDTVVDLAVQWLDRLDKQEMSYSYNNSPFPTFMAYEFARYIENDLSDSAKSNDVRVLTQNEHSKLELMNDINKEWKEAVFNHIEGLDADRIDEEYLNNRSVNSDQTWTGITTPEYPHYYLNKMVKTDDWLDMVEAMQKASIGYEPEVVNTF
ncbi:hypothetical protein J2S77_002790 [Alkalibacillus salilacus]|uniref:Chemotaxis methyl-accepting receptor HlyB-like 4HB MCP domain-containing protein n=1 Tax=Alkalibacillus salilacus TaxID=284582 RepID=A0ABT9VII0_9BACI|nr:hypothetical protein [Alkalibacillus salilacus]